MNYLESYELENYSKSLLLILTNFSKELNEEKILMIIKNLVALNNFSIHNSDVIKKLVFWYFFLRWLVDFSNGYTLICKKEYLEVNFNFFMKKEYETLTNYSQFFDFGKNEIFLNKIVDTTIATYSDYDKATWKAEANTIFDFFILFLYENFELYSLEWEHFPLFKWLINELAEDL